MLALIVRPAGDDQRRVAPAPATSHRKSREHEARGLVTAATSGTRQAGARGAPLRESVGEHAPTAIAPNPLASTTAPAARPARSGANP